MLFFDQDDYYICIGIVSNGSRPRRSKSAKKPEYTYFVLHGPDRDEGGGLDDDFHGNNSDDSRPNSNQSSCVITKEQVSDNLQVYVLYSIHIFFST